MSAQKAAHVGADQLVPPTAVCVPLMTIRAGSLGSAAEATSGTSLMVPDGTPAPFCQDGRPKTTLIPPPLPDQADSLVTLPFASSISVVPPTPVTSGSDVG